jgi:Arc/MetJ family transcription regulator
MGLEVVMATNLHIDEELLDEARRRSGLATKRETVEVALREFIARRQRLEALALFGTVDFEPGYDPKQERARR